MLLWLRFFFKLILKLYIRLEIIVQVCAGKREYDVQRRIVEWVYEEAATPCSRLHPLTSRPPLQRGRSPAQEVLGRGVTAELQ